MIYDEFTKLKECIVGISYKNIKINGLDKIVDETNEDLQNLQYILEDLNKYLGKEIGISDWFDM